MAFQQNLCFPFFSRAVLARSKWVQTGATIATASMWGDDSTSHGSEVTCTPGKSRAARFCATIFESQTTEAYATLDLMEVPNDARAPITIANDTYLNHV